MEPFSYFTDQQKIVLKKLWIPAIIAALLSIYVNHEIYHVVNLYPGKDAFSKEYTITFYEMGLLFAIILAWEQIIRNDWKRTIAIIAGYMATLFIFKTLQSYINNRWINDPALFFIWNCAQIIGICAIAEKKDYLRTGVFAGVLIYACAFFPGGTNLLSFDGYDLLAAFHGLALPYLIWTWMYIAENRVASQEYKEGLNSKIQPVAAAEYRLIFPVAAITTWVTIMCIINLFNPLSAYSRYSHGVLMVSSSTLYILLCGFAFITAVRLTRNIAVRKLMTIGEQGDWLLFLHFVPGINIIAWLVCNNKENEHSTREENAAFYLARNTSSLGAFIITFIVLVNLYNTYQCYAYASYGDSTALIFMCLFIAKIITAFLLRKGGQYTVILMVVLNVVTAPAQLASRLGGTEVIVISALFSVASYYYLIEVFAPALNKKDMAVLPESYAAAYV